jgi:hypothetical protein
MSNTKYQIKPVDKWAGIGYIGNMIDVNKIRSMKKLEELKRDLMEFVNFDRRVLTAVYNSEDIGDEDDLDADIDSACELLSKVKYRMKSLGRYLATADKNGTRLLSPRPQETEASSATD